MQAQHLLNVPATFPTPGVALRRRTTSEQFARDAKALWLRLLRTSVRPQGETLPYL